MAVIELKKSFIAITYVVNSSRIIHIQRKKKTNIIQFIIRYSTIKTNTTKTFDIKK